MQIKITHTLAGSGESYHIGQVIDVDTELATELLNAQLATAVKSEGKTETAVKKNKTETPESNA